MERMKYPRTYHLPFSKGASDDDKILDNDDIFKRMEVVVTEKMDGENSTIYKDYYHARSIDSKHKSYHSWLLAYMKCFQYLLPDNYRICGEYLYATHSIYYGNLKNYFLAFSVWNEDICLSWDDTIDFLNTYGINSVPIIYRGIYDSTKIEELAKEVVSRGGEGIVVRNVNSFKYEDFSKNVAKYVRENHIMTSSRWDEGTITTNRLKNNY